MNGYLPVVLGLDPDEPVANDLEPGGHVLEELVKLMPKQYSCYLS